MESRSEHPRDAQSSLEARKSGVFTIVLPLLVLAAFTTLLTGAAALFGSNTEQMIVIVVISGGLTLLLVAVLIGAMIAINRDESREQHAVEERLASMVETAMDAIIAMDESHNVVLFNKAAESIFGRQRASAIGQKLEMLLPERHRAGHTHHVAAFGRTGVTSRRMGDQTVLMGLRATGEEFPIDASISQQGEPGQKIYTVILRDVSLRVQNQRELQRSREEIRELASVSQTAREQERSRVARELHDEIGGALTALKMDTAWISERLPSSEAVLADKLTNMRSMLDITVAATRRISSDLRPMMLDDLGLAAAAEWLVNEFQHRTGIVCELAIALPEADLSDALATAVFRILQESLTNITKHANATHAEITLDSEEGTLTLTVRDNGRGFDTALPRAPRSFGLIGMRERVSLLGGQIRVESIPGDGTIVEARIPLPHSGTINGAKA